MTKNGLVLEGGGMRGGYTAGVLDAFIEEGISFDYCIGVSAGACNALSYIGRQKGRYIRANTEYLRDPRYMGIRCLFKTGHYLGNRFIFDDITNELVPLDFDAYQDGTRTCPFTAVTTDCATGSARYDVISDLNTQWKLVEASSSLPLVSPVVFYKGNALVDGGVADSIPIRRAEEDGCTHIVAILTQDPSYRKKKSHAQLLIQLAYHKKYPKLVEALRRRRDTYNMQLDYAAQQEKAGKVFLIRPIQPVTVGRMERNPEKIRSLYQIGYLDGKANAAKVKTFLSGR